MDIDPNLRKGWEEVVTPDDLDAHMEATGQGKCNARLTAFMLDTFPLPKGSKILIPGCGTGQLFDFLPPKLLKKYEFTCTDINPSFLASLRNRLINRPSKKISTITDDIEATKLEGPFDGVLAILLLEHTDWEKVVESIVKLKPQKIYIIIQENLNQTASIITTQRQLRESIRKFAEMAKSHSVSRSELTDNLAEKGYGIVSLESEEVSDNKKMTAMVFERL